jgi:hypothetical protein
MLLMLFDSPELFVLNGAARAFAHSPCHLTARSVNLYER